MPGRRHRLESAVTAAVDEVCPAEGVSAGGRYRVGQRRRLSWPTRRSSSPTRWRRAAFSVWSRATSAALSRARVCRQRAMPHRGEQTRCGLRPVRGAAADRAQTGV
jgi:hypothetical protein